MDMALFRRMLPSLAQCRFLALNGIGEPLLHPQLDEMIALARATMPAHGIIGFQSNGLLLDQSRADRLLAAGLDLVCLSLDCLEPVAGDSGEHHRSPVERAIGHLALARRNNPRWVGIGPEAALKRETAAQLPMIVEWAGARGVDSIIVSRLFSYDGAMENESLFNPSSAEATALFAKWAQTAQSRIAHSPAMVTSSSRWE
jgi:MoaA/NifB/PqqE/SkfB family radical SAM enzyme